jgi:hypothetical protein
MSQDQLNRIEQKLDQLLEEMKKVTSGARRLKSSAAMKQTDEEWLAETKQAYHWVDWPTELTKMQTWLALPKNKGRHMTRDFILKWINKIPAPVQVKVPVQAPPAYKKTENANIKGEPPPPEVARQLSRLMGGEWGRM